MRTSFALPLLALLVLLPGPSESAEGPDDAARIQLAAANAPGDLLSDAYLVEMLDLTLQQDSQRDHLDPALRKEVIATRDRLKQRVANDLDDEPAILATLGNCFGRYKEGTDCPERMDRLAEAGHDNGYYHFVLLSEAARNNDAAGFSRHAQSMVDAEVFRPVFLEVFSSLYQRYRQVPVSLWSQDMAPYGPEASPGISAMAQAAAVALPNYQSLYRFCEASADQSREDCVVVARKLTNESTVLLEQFIGTGLLEKVGDASDQALAQELRREGEWLQKSLAAMEDEMDDGQIGEYFDIFARDGEFAAMRFASKTMGRPVEPPADWQP